MSKFEVKVQPIFIKEHPNADSLEIGNIGSPDGWQVVVRKGQYTTGDLVAYIGENAVVPDTILKQYGFWNNERDKGMLAGSKGNRVKAVKLRGEFSLGICIPVIKGPNDHIVNLNNDEILITAEGQDIADWLGIIKYEPPIPTQLVGEVYNGGMNIGVNYDIENIKNYPDKFIIGEQVQITEKLHGTFCQLVLLPFTDEFYHEEHLVVDNNNQTAYVAVGSKGLGARGIFLKHNEQNKNNVYLRAVRNLYDVVIQHYPITVPITICGEVFGDGVQDLKYGHDKGQISFRVFDIYIGSRGNGTWMSDSDLDKWCVEHNIERVPVLYRGPFSKETIDRLTQGTKSVFDEKQIREGIVIKTIPERYDHDIGRMSLKYVSEDYLLRKGKTTEFQ